MKLLLSLLLALAAVPLGDPPIQDVVEISGGKQLKGRVVFEGRDVLRVRTGRGEVEIDRAKVTEIRSLEHSLEEFLQRFDAMPRGDAAANVALAGWCKDRGLLYEALNLGYRALLADPNNEAAAKLCDARRVAGKRLQVKSDGSWLDFDTFRSMKAS